jgi:hypothetical protein
MSFARALISGFVGARTLTLIHETARRVNPNAPRMDILGMRAISKSLRAMGINRQIAQVCTEHR